MQKDTRPFLVLQPTMLGYLDFKIHVLEVRFPISQGLGMWGLGEVTCWWGPPLPGWIKASLAVDQFALLPVGPSAHTHLLFCTRLRPSPEACINRCLHRRCDMLTNSGTCSTELVSITSKILGQVLQKVLPLPMPCIRNTNCNWHISLSSGWRCLIQFMADPADPSFFVCSYPVMFNCLWHSETLRCFKLNYSKTLTIYALALLTIFLPQ